MLAKLNCLRLLKHAICCALSFAPAKAGINRAARMAMMAMTTSNSISVKAGQRNFTAADGCPLRALNRGSNLLNIIKHVGIYRRCQAPAGAGANIPTTNRAAVAPTSGSDRCAAMVANRYFQRSHPLLRVRRPINKSPSPPMPASAITPGSGTATIWKPAMPLHASLTSGLSVIVWELPVSPLKTA